MTKEKIEVKKTTTGIATIVIVAVLALALILYFNSNTDSNQDIEGRAIENQLQDSEISEVLVEGDPVLGNKNASITVVEFSDFECPYCKSAYESTIGGLKNSQMFKEGDVNLVYKHLPLRKIHPDAQKAAEASECANRQGMFWEYHDKLFQNQNSLGVSSLKQYAEDIDLNTDKFNSCLDNGEASEKISEDMEIAQNEGARGTPYFVVINRETGQTQTVSGAVPWEQMESAIQQVM